MPSALYKFYRINKRRSANVSASRVHKSKMSQDFFLYKGIKMFNDLPNNIKYFSKKQFKVALKKHLRSDTSVT